MNKAIVSILKGKFCFNEKVNIPLTKVVKFRKAHTSMKLRTFIFIIISTLITAQSSGQQKKVALGLAFSPTLNWLKPNSSQLESQGSKLGFNYGLMADFNFGENYAFATGLFINNGGGKLKASYLSDSTNISIEENIKIQSVRFPIALRMTTKEIGYFKYYGLFGFNLDYMINASADFKYNGGDEIKGEDIKDEINPLNLSLNLGIGFLYNLSGTTNFLVGLQFNNGFMDVLKGSSDDGVDYKAQANQFALNLGVLF